MLTWTTKDGRELQISEMEDAHLLNTIQYLERTAEARRLQLSYSMSSYAADAPDGAAMCAEMGSWQLIEMSDEDFLLTDEHYCAMKKEAKRRKLKCLSTS